MRKSKGEHRRTANCWQIMLHANLTWIKHIPSLPWLRSIFLPILPPPFYLSHAWLTSGGPNQGWKWPALLGSTRLLLSSFSLSSLLSALPPHATAVGPCLTNPAEKCRSRLSSFSAINGCQEQARRRPVHHIGVWMEKEWAFKDITSFKKKQGFMTLFHLPLFLVFVFCFVFSHNFMIFSWGWWCFKTGELAGDE